MGRYYVAEIECKKFWNCLINANLISSQEFRLGFFRAPSYKIPLTASPLIFNQFKARTLELKTIFGCVNFFSSKATLIFKNGFCSSVQTKKQFKAVRPDAVKMFTGLDSQVRKYRAIFELTYSHNYCQIQYAQACFHF